MEFRTIQGATIGCPSTHHRLISCASSPYQSRISFGPASAKCEEDAKLMRLKIEAERNLYKRWY